MSRGLRFSSEEDMPEGMRKLVQQAKRPDGIITLMPRGAGKTTAANKYFAVPTRVDGIRFDSKREAAYYELLKFRVAAGEVSYFLRQVPIHMPGGTRLVIDFLEVMAADGSLRYVDVKGRETAAFKIKRREIEAIYPIRILLA